MTSTPPAASTAAAPAVDEESAAFARVRRGALLALREGRVRVLHVDVLEYRAGRLRPRLVRAEVDGHRGLYRVERTAAGWTCSCRRAAPCAHETAVRLIAGDPPPQPPWNGQPPTTTAAPDQDPGGPS